MDLHLPLTLPLSFGGNPDTQIPSQRPAKAEQPHNVDTAPTPVRRCPPETATANTAARGDPSLIISLSQEERGEQQGGRRGRERARETQTGGARARTRNAPHRKMQQHRRTSASHQHPGPG
ncbi:hypothetical protein CORC01_13311 [Colletotrichum orchidophilum]|uniref:Uncharacterized protein n=1 Tax=Colletotrichum orchidophilum TaxID=1209926 RepID=A0A1G4AQM5_9PEZI|nr:uncharacterized protein CORC01_13311 [Colletotrichum orchidophilum]OHE91393.1 hypothetical protein CORC01_13311 [Colletotrichum orchidophilum]